MDNLLQARTLKPASKKFLLGIYLVIPLSLLAVVLDRFFWNGTLRNTLPVNPQEIFVFSILFRKPHIVASSLEFFDPEYFRAYAKRLAPPFLLLAAGLVFVPSVFHTGVFRAILVTWTAFHLIGQQFSITRFMGRGFDHRVDLWKWSALGIGLLMFLETHLHSPFIRSLGPSMAVGSWLLVLPFLYFGRIVYGQADSNIARGHVFANVAMMLSCLLLYSQGYSFFVFLIPRVIHDLSSFAFYISHDANRNFERPRNFIYRALHFSRIPVSWLCPIVAIALAFPVTYYLESREWAYRIAILITLFHYYTESIVWKRGSLNRQFVAVA